MGLLAIACASPDRHSSADSSAWSNLPGAAHDSATAVALTGAGATFPYPLYARWFNAYAERSGVRINYRSVGSEEGIAALRAGSVDFGATDVRLSDAERASLGTQVIHIPTALGAVAIVYNLPAVSQQLRFDGGTLADIYLGRVSRWNDARIASLNPGVALPALPIAVVHRDDGSGTSHIMSEYLGAVSDVWRSAPGRRPARRIEWPVGVGASGNEGVAGAVKQTEGSIGYVEVVYARQNRLAIARVRNRAGQYVTPMAYEIAAAADFDQSTDSPDGMPRSLVNAPGRSAYPIASFTWMLVPPRRLGPQKTARLSGFLKWALSDGGDMASALGYVPLPTAVADRVIAALDSLSGVSPP